MSAGRTDWVDIVIDNGVAALFALACAFPALMLLGDQGRAMAVLAGVIALMAFAAARGLLRQMGRARAATGHRFELAPLPPSDEPELLELGESHRFISAQGEKASDALVLEDILAAVGPEARVVQLFGRQAPVTAGELVRRIDRHLADRPQAVDDSSALFDALDKLRRSLS